MVSRPRKFTPSTEEPTCQKASCPSPILNLQSPHSQLANWEGLLCFFCLWSLGQATHFGFVNTQFCSYPVCPDQKVTVIFGFVPIAPPNVISHILLPISALNRQSLWWSQACFKIPWEPQCQAITTLELEMERPWSGAGWHSPCESLWKHCPQMLWDWAAGESICQMRSWPPDILKRSTICGMLGLPSGILVTLKFGLFYSIFGSLAVSNVLKKNPKYIFFRLQK